MNYLDVMSEFGVPETVARVYESLGPLTALDDQHGFTLLWYVDALVGTDEQLLETFVRDSGGRSGWGNTIDVDIAPDEALRWLGQFVGVIINRSSRVSVRDQIRLHPSYARGSVPAIIAAVKDFLDPPKRCGIIERATVSGTTVSSDKPWQYTVVVHEDDLSSYTYAELALAYPTYAGVAAAFPHYSDMDSVFPVVQSIVANTKPGGDIATAIAVVNADYVALSAHFTPIP